MNPRISASVVIALTFTAVLATSAGAEPAIAFEESAVVVDGLAVGGRVALSGAAIGRDGYVRFLFRQDEVLTADAVGSVRLELDRPLPAESVWFAIDLDGGELTVAAPDGAELREIAMPGRALRPELDGLDDDRRFLYVLLVRPAAAAPGEAGAWTTTVGDGSESDGDGREDGRLSALLSGLAPLGDSPPAPERLAPGLVFVAVDPMTLEFYAATLGR